MEIVFGLIMFGIGITIGIYIMTLINNEKERKFMDQLLELEDNIGQLRDLKDIYKNNQCTCKNE